MPELAEQIALWKAEFGDVFAIGDEYIFRALKVGEHRELIRHREWSAPESEDYIVQTCVLQPTFEVLESKAGLISSLAEEVLSLSGYGEVQFAKQVIDEARERAQQVVNLMKIFIIAAMPAYTDDSLDEFTFAQLAFKVAMAEQIIDVRNGGHVLELIDPAEEAAKAEVEAKKQDARRKPGQAASVDPIAQKLKNALG